ncbi:MAG: hypothetical protein ACQKBW_02635 [Puniceicoccales bacterium]
MNKKRVGDKTRHWSCQHGLHGARCHVIMGKQSNKVIKRKRRLAYKARKKAANPNKAPAAKAKA